MMRTAVVSLNLVTKKTNLLERVLWCARYVNMRLLYL